MLLFQTQPWKETTEESIQTAPPPVEAGLAALLLKAHWKKLACTPARLIAPPWNSSVERPLVNASRSKVTSFGVVKVRIRLAPLPVRVTAAPAAARTVKLRVCPPRSGKMVHPPGGAEYVPAASSTMPPSGTVSSACCREAALLTGII